VQCCYAGHICPTYKEFFKSAGITVSHFFNGIKILQGRWQHGEKVGYCYPSRLEKTLCEWDVYVPLVTKGLNTKNIAARLAFHIITKGRLSGFLFVTTTPITNQTDLKHKMYSNKNSLLHY
jgi:hypothetical protein